MGINFYSAPKQLEGTLPISIPNLLAIEFILMHFVEIRRWMDFRNKGVSAEDSTSPFSFIKSQEVGYPGGIFDPLGMSKKDLKTQHHPSVLLNRKKLDTQAAYLILLGCLKKIS